MKVLMITQKIDKDDDILGVYHEWAREIGEAVGKLSVICLLEGRNELPENIKILSLGKERGWSRAKYLRNFYAYIWRLRNDYDTVFVHMNPIYMILGWFVWSILRKKRFLWYAHPGWNWKVKAGYFLSHKVITSVPEAFHARGKKILVVGQGIDTEIFKRNPDALRKNGTILSMGRFSQAKRVHLMLEALSRVNLPYNFSIVGGTSGDGPAADYERYLRDVTQKLGISDNVKFYKSVPYKETVERYNSHKIFLNLSPTGYFDKTVLEAMSSECIPIVSNDAYKNIFPREYHEFLIHKQDDVDDLTKKIERMLKLPDEEIMNMGKELRDIVVRDHSISTLGKRLAKAFSI
jgi:glycosyltransferase involved in cell wall biosynthesis